MGKHPGRGLRDLILEAGGKALADAGIDRGRIEALYMSNFNSQYLCYQGHMGPLASEVLGLGNIPTMRAEGACASGSIAFRQALMVVQAGFYDVVMVGGVEKMTHRETETVTTGIASAADFELEANVGITFPSIFAMMANRYAHEYGDPREAMAVCAVQNHDSAMLNPDAQMHKRITVEQVKGGFPIAYPLTVFDCSLVTDGAAFVILAALDVARELAGRRAVEVIGCGQAGDTLTAASKKSLTTLAATARAAQDAYRMAGVGPGDIDLAEVHDCFTITQILNIEDLGFCAKGKGVAAVLAGETGRAGRIPVNVSGGLKAKGHPIGATGLSQIFEMVTQLRGEAGERQVAGAETGLTHNLGGTAATCLVSIFRGVE
jgi:acetyl-CoA C-acetyltransferase